MLHAQNEEWSSAQIWTQTDLIYFTSTTILLVFVSQLISGKVLSLKVFAAVQRHAPAITKTIIGTLLLPVITAAFVPVYALLWVLAKGVELHARHVYKGNAHKATGMDGVWGLNNRKSHSYIHMIIKATGQPDVDRMRAHFDQRIIRSVSTDGCLRFPKLQQIFFKHLGYFFWRTHHDFDIREHIREVDLVRLYPRKSEHSAHSFCVEDRVCQYLEEHSSDSINRGATPQWELLLLKENQQEHTHLLRIHHAYGDGLSFNRLLLEFYNDQPMRPPDFCLRPPLWSRVITAIWAFILIPFALPSLLPKGGKNPLHTGHNTGRKIFVTSSGVPLHVMKEIKNKTRTTINDVLFTSISAAVTKFFEARSHIGTDFTILFPIGFQDLDSPLELSNKFSIGLASIPTPARGHSKCEQGFRFRRLYCIKRSLAKVTQDATIMSLYYLTALFSELLPCFASQLVFNTKGITMGVSNMPGPKESLGILGEEVTEIRFWVPDRDPTGVGLAVISYKDMIRIGFTVDAGLVQDRSEVETLLNDVILEIQKLAEDVRIT